MTDELKWWQRPLRMIRFDPLNDYSAFLQADLDAHARTLRERYHGNVEWIMANGGCAPGTASVVNFDSDVYEKNPTLGERDYLREYVPIAQSHGIKVLAYTNLHWFSYAFAEVHPGWEQVLSDGRSYGRVNPLYGNGTTLCVNSPWRDWAYALVAEIMSTGVDGAFLDGPVMFPGACYCPACRDAYRADTGKDAPEVEDWSGEDWRLWQNFREHSMERFLAGARDAVTGVNPEGIVFLNAGGYGLSPRVARNPWRLEDHQHITGAEEFVHPGAPGEDWLDSAVMAKFLSAGCNPAVVFSHHCLGGWHYVGMTPADIKRECYQTAAGGASPWFGVFWPSLDHQREKTMSGVIEAWGFLEKHDDLFTADEPAARVGVLRSETSGSAYLSAIPGLSRGAGVAVERDLIATSSEQTVQDTSELKQKCEGLGSQEFRGWCYALTRQHIPFRVLRDRDLTPETLAGIDLLVAPNASNLGDEELAALQRWCEAGGHLVSTFETGWYQPDSSSRPAGEGGLGMPRPKDPDIFAPATFEEYGEVQTAGGEVESFEVGELLPRPEYAIQVRTPRDADDLVRYLKPIGAHYRRPQGLSEFSMAFRGRRGAGSWAYLSCLPGAEWLRFKIPQWERLMGGVIRQALGENLQLVAQAPPPLQIELRRQPRRLNVHLVNNCADSQFPISQILPAGRISLGIRADRPARVLTTQGGEVAFEYREGRVHLTRDIQEQYEILSLEYE